MRSSAISVFLVQVILLTPLICFADTFNCNGIWRDRPCGESGPRADAIISSSGEVNQPKKIKGTSMPLDVKASSVNSSRCPTNAILISTRPDPHGTWTVQKRSESMHREDLGIKGSVRGYGKVLVKVVGSANIRGHQQSKTLYSQTMSLPNEGGEKDFEVRFTLYPSWVWNMSIENMGLYKGYCSTESEQLVNAKRQADEAKQTAEQALRNSKTAVDLASSGR